MWDVCIDFDYPDLFPWSRFFAWILIRCDLQPRNDPDPEMNPNPEMIPKSTPKWYRAQNDPHFSSRRPRNDPELTLGMEWYPRTMDPAKCTTLNVSFINNLHLPAFFNDINLGLHFEVD